jgi:hypothetical protein
VLAAIGVVTGIAGMIAASRRGLTADKPGVLLGTVLSALILAVMGLQFYTASSVPPSTTSPPTWSTRPGSKPWCRCAARCQPASTSMPRRSRRCSSRPIPWVRPLELRLPPEQALRAPWRRARRSGPGDRPRRPRTGGRVEATATTFWFGFKDDVVVRVRPAAAGSVVDVRSVSRVGVSDLGANARRIGRILDGMADG